MLRKSTIGSPGWVNERLRQAKVRLDSVLVAIDFSSSIFFLLSIVAGHFGLASLVWGAGCWEDGFPSIGTC